MAIFKAVETVSSSLDNIPVKEGQMITVSDEQTLHVDTSDLERIQIQDIIKLDTEQERLMMFSPITDKLYLIKESNKMYRYDGEDWIDLFSNSITIQRKSHTININTSSIPLGINNFINSKDSIILYKNSVYLEENVDYRVSENKIYPIEGVWEANAQANGVFNILIFKNVASSNLNTRSISQEEIQESKNIEIDRLKLDNAILYYTLMTTTEAVRLLLTYDKIAYFYTEGLWTKDMVNEAKFLGLIDEYDFELIVGK